MAEWEDKLPPLLREKLTKVGEASPEEKARLRELKSLDSLLAEFFKGTLDSEALYEQLKEYEGQGKQFLLKEARARLKASFRAEKLRIKFEESSDGRLSVQLLEEEEVEERDEAIKQETNLVIELTVDNFDEQLKKYPLLVVDCWAAWCAPCRMVAPVIEGLARDYRGKVAFGKLDVDKNPSLAMKYRIMSIPTLLVFKDGQLIDQNVGAMPRGALESLLARHIAKG